MIVRRYLDPISEINAIRRQINDVFGDFAAEVLPRADWAPAVRLLDQGDHFLLTAHVVGIEPEALNVQVTADTISLEGQRPEPTLPEDTKLLYDDVRYGQFQRVINLPEPIQNSLVTAEFNHGILTLTLPKVVESQTKVVKITLGAPTLEARQPEGEGTKA
ncbi:heat-shock protein Hsp20 [Leptolyngbya sp. BL0902]|uniref:Hsp20/alpha crystallin family protein n=1 Tax=Leptolyngbya sp. BL0902 TaxID=1115757 RepID=UPI0018E8725E|nr:Hsp20/alpha crystallin family protein [Leptolyngbya sp. BL0902]QQE66186.1 heat-shock protein Hsp20 [Leptolyngbya sp. BL0902]